MCGHSIFGMRPVMSLTLSNLRRSQVSLICFITIGFLWLFHSLWISRPVIDPTYGVLRKVSSSSRYAIATFLAGDESEPLEDPYFVATRILTYQLLHANETRCSRNLPFLVLVTHKVSQNKRDQLAKDGAEVVPVEDLPLSWWIKTGVTRWRDQFTKLRLLEMVEYDRILFIDADTLLTRPIDDIFDEPVVRDPAETKFHRTRQILSDEAQLPAQYVFAVRSDNALTGERDHPFPPLPTLVFSAGFWVAAPSKEMFKYLLSVMGHWRRFNPHEMEQSLLNYAFRRAGVMPWVELDYRWSATWPSIRDLEGGVASLHEKFWKTGPEELVKVWRSWKERMEAYYNTSNL
jgi:alpha-N-acetylglucosamine transferase